MRKTLVTTTITLRSTMLRSFVIWVYGA